MQSEHEYWFPAKRYGWGWSIPNTWQGWLVLAAFFGMLVAGYLVVPLDWRFFVYLAALCALLVGVCWLKGEPLRWRWGRD